MKKASVVTEQGTFMMLKLDELTIDLSYQREEVSPKAVRKIANEWCWLSCGVLRVIIRKKNKKAYIIDGQHRFRGAEMNGKIEELPCLVFNGDKLTDEAIFFLRCNCNRVPIGPYVKYHAALAAKDANALQTKKLLDKHGYRAVKKGTADNTIRCITGLQRMVDKNMTNADRSFGLAVAINFGFKQVRAELLIALSFLLLHIEEDITDGYCRQKLIGAGPELLEKLIRQERILNVNKGARGHAQALIDFLNKGRNHKNWIYMTGAQVKLVVVK